MFNAEPGFENLYYTVKAKGLEFGSVINAVLSDRTMVEVQVVGKTLFNGYLALPLERITNV